MEFNYDFTYNMDDEIGTVFGIFYIIYYLLSIGLSITAYVLGSLGLYTIAKRRGINHPWLSWIPVGSAWILGSVSDQYRYITRGQIKSKRKILLVLELVTVVLMIVWFVVMIARMTELAMFSVTAGEDYITANAVSLVLGMLGMMLVLLGVVIVTNVFRYMALYDVYNSVNPAYSVVFIVLSIIFSITEPFFLFFNRKKDLGMPPRCDVPVEPVPTVPQYLPPRQPIQEPWENPEE